MEEKSKVRKSKIKENIKGQHPILYRFSKSIGISLTFVLILVTLLSKVFKVFSINDIKALFFYLKSLNALNTLIIFIFFAILVICICLLLNSINYRKEKNKELKIKTVHTEKMMELENERIRSEQQIKLAQSIISNSIYTNDTKEHTITRIK